MRNMQEDGKNRDFESVRTEKHDKNSNLMASKAEKRKTEWGERTEASGNNEWGNQVNWGGNDWWKNKETTVTGKVS